MDIVTALEQGAHSLLSSLNVPNICLGLRNLLDESFDTVLYSFQLIECALESVQVVDLTLDPVIEIREGIPEVL